MPSPPLAAIQPRDLRLVRQAQGRRLEDVATAIGIDASTLSRIERGERPLTPDVTIKLLRLLFHEESAHGSA